MVSVEVVRLGELLDERAAAPGGGAGGACGRGERRGEMHGTQRRRQARVRAAAALAAVRGARPLASSRPQVRVGAVQLELPAGEQARVPRVRRAAVQVRVCGRRALVALHLAGGRAAETELGRAAALRRRRTAVKLGRVSGGCVVLYFTDRIVGVVHCRCDIKAAACNKIETFN